MSNVFTLDDLEEALEHDFAPLTFKAGDDEFVLQNLLRVDRKKREQVIAQLERLDKLQDSEEDSYPEDEIVACIHAILKAVVKGSGKGTKLVGILGDDVLRSMTLLKKWTEATAPGEAERSPA